MDIIKELSSQLGIDAGQAQALAGTVIGGIHGTVAKENAGAATSLASAIPELGDWKSKAEAIGGTQAGGGLASLLGGSGGVGGMLGGAMSALGGSSDAAGLAGMVSKLGIDGSKASLIAPIVLNFLKSRVDPQLLATLQKFAPMLSGGGIGGVIGGFLK